MNEAPFLSLCIPTYEMGGDGARYLDDSLARIAAQDFHDLEVVVADQSEDDAVARICAARAGDLRLRRIDTRATARTSSANTNAAMRAARGQVLKILFQDDLLVGKGALARIAAAFDDPATSWVLCGSGVTRDGMTIDRPMVPRIEAGLEYGRNTVSSPSVLALRAGRDLWFDEDLIWLMDVEFYRRCADRLGPPAILEETLVANRLHAGQVSARVDRALKRRELRQVRARHRQGATWPAHRAYLWQRLKLLGP
jgi:glycosyltransferase involved in cell wall biosynthesis